MASLKLEPLKSLRLSSFELYTFDCRLPLQCYMTSSSEGQPKFWEDPSAVAARRS
jgi:hypothetical protein